MKKNVLFFFILGVFFSLPMLYRLIITVIEVGLKLLPFIFALALFLLMQIPTIITYFLNKRIEIQIDKDSLNKWQSKQKVIQNFLIAFLMVETILINLFVFVTLIPIPSPS